MIGRTNANSNLDNDILSECLDIKFIYLSTTLDTVSYQGRAYTRSSTEKCLVCKIYIDNAYYSFCLITKTESGLSGSHGDLGGITKTQRTTRSGNNCWVGSMTYAHESASPLYINDTAYTSDFFDFNRAVDMYLLDVLIDDYLFK